MGSWQQVKTLLAGLGAMTTDQGTERLLSDIPTSWAEVAGSSLLPQMLGCDHMFGYKDLQEPKPHKCPLANKCGRDIAHREVQAKRHRHALFPQTLAVRATPQSAQEPDGQSDVDEEVDYSDMPRLVEMGPDDESE